MKEVEVDRLKEKLRDQIKFVEAEQEAVELLMEEISGLANSVTDKPEVQKSLQELQDIDRNLSSKCRTLTKEVAFYEQHDNCPTCKQGIEHDFKEATVSSHSAKTLEIEDARAKLEHRAIKLEERLEAIDKTQTVMNELHLSASEHRANHKMSMNSCKIIKEELTGAEKEVVAIDNNEIVDLETGLTAYHTKQVQLFDDKETLTIVGSMLKDGGIKTRIIKQYVPVMNKLIGKYLSAMDFFVQFELDENFNETIKSRFRDEFSYSSFSEGEKLRIDLALLFTWRAVSKLRNSVSTNLLIMDEIMDSSLDSTGTEEFLKIIEELTSDSNIFIISHKGDQLFDKFHSVIRFEKVKNFSRIAI